MFTLHSIRAGVEEKLSACVYLYADDALQVSVCKSLAHLQRLEPLD